MSSISVGANMPISVPTQAGADDTAPVASQNMVGKVKDPDLERVGGKADLLAGKQIGAQALKEPDGDRTLPQDMARKLAAMSQQDVLVDSFAFMALFQKMAQTMRESAMQDRTASMERQLSALDDAASKMKEAAAQRFAAAVVSGAIQIASGALQAGVAIGGGAMQLRGSNMKTEAADLGEFAQATKFNAQQLGGVDGIDLHQIGANAQLSANALSKAGTRLETTGGAIQQGGKSVGEMAQGAGAIGKAGLEFGASKTDAEKMAADAQATVERSQYEKANDLVRHMQDLIRDIQEKLSSIEQAASDTRKQITRA